MHIQKMDSNTQSFGMKIPTKTAIEVATGCYLDNARRSNRRQYKLLEKVSGLDIKNLYTGEVVTGLRNLSLYLKTNYPKLAAAADNIRKVCDEINANRTFFPEDELLILKKLAKVWNEEAKKIGTRSIDIEPLSLQQLGLDKYM